MLVKRISRLFRSAIPLATRGKHSAASLEEPKRAVLVLQDGTEMEGYSFGAEKDVAGEVVFSTGMVGYPEALTDPSFKGQVVVLTYPIVGSYGVPDRKARDALGLPKFFESSKLQVQGLVVQDYAGAYSHWNAKSSLGDWLKEEGVPGIGGVDTRALTVKIRDNGAMLGKVIFDGGSPVANGPFHDPNTRNLVAEVSTPGVAVYGKGNPFRVLAVDCGIKNNMIRMMVARGMEVKVVPWNHDLVSEADWYHGLFISNGPGDPSACGPLVEQLRRVISLPGPAKPIFGICLGNQLMSLAAGASTYKLPFGNRGQNQPVINLETGHAFITPQNHGYAIDTTTLSSDWAPLFRNANDGSNEGIVHKSKPFFTAQFHPEAQCGPDDTAFLFDTFLETIKSKSNRPVHTLVRPERLPKPVIKKVLLLGSGGLSIGQAGEFDYSGSQAIKALKEAGHKVVLMNPNIASVQTNVDESTLARADSVYFLPVTPAFIEMVIKKERPDAIMVSMGGQTALNCGVALHEAGVFKKYNVQVLGTQIDAIVATEDRQIFADKLNEIKEKLAPSITAENIEDAVTAAYKIGFPVMIRSAFALGGLGSGICTDEKHLRDMASRAFALTNQILVEKSLKGWKEVEYEVVRDVSDNCITVCNMENFDPLGVHTGDSIVVAPSQTLSNEEYHMLRNTAIKVVRHIGIVGECNIQYALDPHSTDYCIIEVNARLSRSSALASKATGYPLAAVAARLSLGLSLPEIENAVTRTTTACFEPSLDYIVTKIPRWDLGKFSGANPYIGSSMKSVGEVMAIGRTFEESFQKALRMVNGSVEGFVPSGREWAIPGRMEAEFTKPTPERPYALAHALYNETHSVDELYRLSAIDPWFLLRLQGIAQASKSLTTLGSLSKVNKAHMKKLKGMGFSDTQIANALNARAAGSASPATMDTVRAARKALGVLPVVKQIDTLAAEYPARTNYLYTTYNGSTNDVEFVDKGVMVLGSGCYRIGSSVEFDWCSVSAIRTLRKEGVPTVVVNFNPETVSTDYDECDRLYFEELSLERVLDIYEAEAARGVIVSMGGQIPNNLALPLSRRGVEILGTSASSIDSSEDRGKFSALMDSIGVPQPPWQALASLEAASTFADSVGYPVLVRPSYVLSGAAMAVAYTPSELHSMLGAATTVSPNHPVVITKFITGASEVEFDGVAAGGLVVAHAVSEHVEPAGVHSGDATLILPPVTLPPFYVSQAKAYAAKVAKALNISGPFNIQFIAKGADVSIIECNLRASRSTPFVSKTVGCDFAALATRVMLGKDVTKDADLPTLDTPPRPTRFVGVKSPMFSFTRLGGADPVLGVEMASTGEVACFGANVHEAFLKSLMASNFVLPKTSILVSSTDKDRAELTHAVFKLKALGFTIYATPSTAAFFNIRGIDTIALEYPKSKSVEDLEASSLVKAIREKKVELVINLGPFSNSSNAPGNSIMRRIAVDHAIPLITNIKLASLLADSLERHSKDPMPGLIPDQLEKYYAAESDADAWVNPSEYH